MTYGQKPTGVFAHLNFRRCAGAALLGVTLAVGSAGVALAQQSCQEDFKKLSDKRLSQMAELNKLAKAAKGKMDPVAACPLARRLVGTENEMLGYMEKNKDWCAIPEQMVETFKQARAKTAGFASQACAVAAKVKKMQEQGEQAASGGGLGQAPKLPSGPL